MSTHLSLLWSAALLWYEKDADYKAATVSYYTLFSLPPLLLLCVTTASMIFGQTVVIETLRGWGGVLGPDILALLQSSVENLDEVVKGSFVPVFGIIFFSSMVVVACNALTSGIHDLWGIEHQGVKGWIKKSVRSISFILFFQIYLLILLTISFFGSGLTDVLGGFFATTLTVFATLVFTTVLFSVMFRMLPRADTRLKARLIGSFVAATLLMAAKGLVALYVGTTPVPGLFGAAGMILALLTWLFVSAGIIYYGASIVHVYNANYNQ